jgi:hypothetical protein
MLALADFCVPRKRMIRGHAQNQFSSGINTKKDQTFSHLLPLSELRPTGFVSAGDLLSHCEFQLFSRRVPAFVDLLNIRLQSLGLKL